MQGLLICRISGHVQKLALRKGMYRPVGSCKSQDWAFLGISGVVVQNGAVLVPLPLGLSGLKQSPVHIYTCRQEALLIGLLGFLIGNSNRQGNAEIGIVALAVGVIPGMEEIPAHFIGQGRIQLFVVPVILVLDYGVEPQLSLNVRLLKFRGCLTLIVDIKLLVRHLIYRIVAQLILDSALLQGICQLVHIVIQLDKVYNGPVGHHSRFAGFTHDLYRARALVLRGKGGLIVDADGMLLLIASLPLEEAAVIHRIDYQIPFLFPLDLGIRNRGPFIVFRPVLHHGIPLGLSLVLLHHAQAQKLVRTAQPLLNDSAVIPIFRHHKAQGREIKLLRKHVDNGGTVHGRAQGRATAGGIVSYILDGVNNLLAYRRLLLLFFYFFITAGLQIRKFEVNRILRILHPGELALMLLSPLYLLSEIDGSVRRKHRIGLCQGYIGGIGHKDPEHLLIGIILSRIFHYHMGRIQHIPFDGKGKVGVCRVVVTDALGAFLQKLFRIFQILILRRQLRHIQNQDSSRLVVPAHVVIHTLQQIVHPLARVEDIGIRTVSYIIGIQLWLSVFIEVTPEYAAARVVAGSGHNADLVKGGGIRHPLVGIRGQNQISVPVVHHAGGIGDGHLEGGIVILLPHQNLIVLHALPGFQVKPPVDIGVHQEALAFSPPGIPLDKGISVLVIRNIVLPVGRLKHVSVHIVCNLCSLLGGGILLVLAPGIQGGHRSLRNGLSLLYPETIFRLHHRPAVIADLSVDSHRRMASPPDFSRTAAGISLFHLSRIGIGRIHPRIVQIVPSGSTVELGNQILRQKAFQIFILQRLIRLLPVFRFLCFLGSFRIRLLCLVCSRFPGFICAACPRSLRFPVVSCPRSSPVRIPDPGIFCVFRPRLLRLFCLRLCLLSGLRIPRRRLISRICRRYLLHKRIYVFRDIRLFLGGCPARLVRSRRFSLRFSASVRRLFRFSAPIRRLFRLPASVRIFRMLSAVRVLLRHFCILLFHLKKPEHVFRAQSRGIFTYIIRRNKAHFHTAQDVSLGQSLGFRIGKACLSRAKLPVNVGGVHMQHNIVKFGRPGTVHRQFRCGRLPPGEHYRLGPAKTDTASPL